MQGIFKLSKEELQTYLKLIIASLIYILPIIIADRYYNDDLARALYGATGWKGDGRPLGEYLILGLCEGPPVVDIAPLPLILSVLLLCYSLILYAKTNLNFFSGYKQTIILLLIIVNPFSVANLSYQFDCIIMLGALSLNFFVFSLSDRINEIILLLAAIVTGILIMSSYQATIGMSLVLFLVNIFFILIEKRTNIKAEIVRMTGIIFGAVIYKIFIAQRFVSQNDWRSDASQLIPDLSGSSMEIVFGNIKMACRYIIQYFLGRSKIYQLLWLILIMGSIILSVVVCYKNTGYRSVKKVGYLFLIVLFPIIIFLATFFPLMLLSKLSIKSRIFIAFGGFLFFIAILLLNFVKKDRLALIVLTVCIFSQYTYIYAYGNAMASQNEYEKYMAYNIVHDIEEMNCDGSYKEFSFVGNMPKSKQLQMMCEKYPFFEEIVPVYFGNSTWIGGAWVYYYMQNDLELVASTEEDEKICNNTSPRIENYIYSCYLKDRKIIIVFK